MTNGKAMEKVWIGSDKEKGRKGRVNRRQKNWIGRQRRRDPHRHHHRNHNYQKSTTKAITITTTNTTSKNHSHNHHHQNPQSQPLLLKSTIIAIIKTTTTTTTKNQKPVLQPPPKTPNHNHHHHHQNPQPEGPPAHLQATLQARHQLPGGLTGLRLPSIKFPVILDAITGDGANVARIIRATRRDHRFVLGISYDSSISRRIFV